MVSVSGPCPLRDLGSYFWAHLSTRLGNLRGQVEKGAWAGLDKNVAGQKLTRCAAPGIFKFQIDRGRLYDVFILRRPRGPDSDPVYGIALVFPLPLPGQRSIARVVQISTACTIAIRARWNRKRRAPISISASQPPNLVEFGPPVSTFLALSALLLSSID